MGMRIRNNWGLWKGSPLSEYFNRLGIYHPDDMTGIIFDSYWRKIHHQPIKLKEQVAYYQEYWKNEGNGNKKESGKIKSIPIHPPRNRFPFNLDSICGFSRCRNSAKLKVLKNPGEYYVFSSGKTPLDYHNTIYMLPDERHTFEFQIIEDSIKSIKYDSYAIQKEKRLTVHFLTNSVDSMNRGSVVLLSGIPRKMKCVAIFEEISDSGFTLKSRAIFGIEPGIPVKAVVLHPTSKVILTKFEIEKQR